MFSPKFDTSQAITFGWETLKKHIGFLVLASLLYLIVATILAGIFGESVQYHHIGSALLVYLVLIVVSILFSAGFLQVGIAYAEGREATWATLLGVPPLRLLRFIGAELLVGIIVGVGFAVFIVPGIYFALRFSQVRYLILDGERSVMQALHESTRLTEGIKWSLLGNMLAIIAVIYAGIFCVGLGVIAALPVAILAQIGTYYQLKQSRTETVAA